jgi:hypothetical protein
MCLDAVDIHHYSMPGLLFRDFLPSGWLLTRVSRIGTSNAVNREVCVNPTSPSCCSSSSRKVSGLTQTAAATQPFRAASTSACSPSLTDSGNQKIVLVAIIKGNTGQENTKKCLYLGPPLVKHVAECEHGNWIVHSLGMLCEAGYSSIGSIGTIQWLSDSSPLAWSV